MSVESVQNIIGRVKNLIPENFLVAKDEVSSNTLESLKIVYDHTKNDEIQTGFVQKFGILKPGKKSKKKRSVGISATEAPLSSLIVDNFDTTQIWELIQLQNGILYDSLVSSISKILAQAKSIELQAKEVNKKVRASKKKRAQVVQELPEFDEEDSSEYEFEGLRSKKRKLDENRTFSNPKKYAKSIVDDKFFNLAQMTEFLEKFESNMDQEMHEHDSESEESINYFEDVEDEENQDEESNGIYYKDFFDEPLDSSKPNSTRTEEEAEDPVSASENELIPEDEEDEDEISDDQSEDTPKIIPEEASSSEDESENELPKLISKGNVKESSKSEQLSSFQKRTKRVEENIKRMEEEALQPKSWQLLGEVTAESRPENSILEETLQFDHLFRQAPLMTKETTLKLEDVIIQRIKDQAWDDVERKAKPVENVVEYKNKLILESEKSKQSLAQIYEQEYINKKKAEDANNDVESVPEEEAKIKSDMTSLFAKLDALSNFYFTPKPAISDVKIVTNLPSIAMEEVAPTSVSDATLLAPQEIQAPSKGEIKSNPEKTSTDRKRERRLKKKKQHLKRVASEEKAKLKGLGLRNVKLAETIISKKSKSVPESRTQSKELKSSKAFFDKLQNTVQTQINDKLTKVKTKTVKKSTEAKKYKL